MKNANVSRRDFASLMGAVLAGALVGQPTYAHARQDVTETPFGTLTVAYDADAQSLHIDLVGDGNGRIMQIATVHVDAHTGIDVYTHNATLPSMEGIDALKTFKLHVDQENGAYIAPEHCPNI